MQRYLARPGQTLDAHLDGVASNANLLVPEDATTPQDEPLQGVARTVAHLHDIGKLTPAFQEYIREDTDRPPKPKEYHSPPGALVTFHALAAQGFSLETAAVGFYAVLWHHQGLYDVQEKHYNWRKQATKYENIGEKLEKIGKTARSVADKRVQEATKGVLEWQDVLIETPTAYQGQFREFQPGEGFYPLLQRVWATLTCADKLDAAFKAGPKSDSPLTSSTPLPDPDDITFENDATEIRAELNELRSDAQEEVARRLMERSGSGREVYTLSLPTGFGKTFAGLNAALRRAKSVDGRVIYALPYTTILDQIDDEIRRQFGVQPTSRAYTLHHHLAETRTELETYHETVSDGSELLYAESWQAGLVLTTFVQLFESVAGPTNAQSVKIPALQDAVIVIDEPQVLSQEWWNLTVQLIDVLETEYDATVILMTATQPRFLEKSSAAIEPEELVEESEGYFDFLDANERVRFEIDTSVPVGERSGEKPLGPSEAADRLVESTVESDESTLAVTNTVINAGEVSRAIEDRVARESLDAYNLATCVREFAEEQGGELVSRLERGDDVEAFAPELIERVGNELTESDLLLATLSAALRPSDRQLLVAIIKTLLDDSEATATDTPMLVTSTQLIEAGVDLSFSQVYRDFAPIPSVVQAAGRCNRAFGDERGQVIVWRLSSPARDQLPCSIYTRRGDRLTPTSVALDRIGAGHDIVSEHTMVTDGVDVYYDTLHSGGHTDYTYDSLVKAYIEAEGETLREASLIDDYGEDVLVIQTDAEWELLQQYLDAKASGAYREGQAILTIIQQLFASVPEERAEELDESAEIVESMGVDIELNEFAVVDVRETALYEISTGTGLRKITD